MTIVDPIGDMFTRIRNGLMRNLKAITKKNIELHAAKVSDISEFIEKLSSDTDEVTIASIRDENRKK